MSGLIAGSWTMRPRISRPLRLFAVGGRARVGLLLDASCFSTAPRRLAGFDPCCCALLAPRALLCTLRSMVPHSRLPTILLSGINPHLYGFLDDRRCPRLRQSNPRPGTNFGLASHASRLRVSTVSSASASRIEPLVGVTPSFAITYPMSLPFATSTRSFSPLVRARRAAAGGQVYPHGQRSADR
ncbi:hypothetical protein DFH06DRAFT_534508 [Mycena polygramma]|nr:hypothetical protein DFH06DRAFT_534508 [Mycena polygramma]